MGVSRLGTPLINNHMARQRRTKSDNDIHNQMVRIQGQINERQGKAFERQLMGGLGTEANKEYDLLSKRADRVRSTAHKYMDNIGKEIRRRGISDDGNTQVSRRAYMGLNGG